MIDLQVNGAGDVAFSSAPSIEAYRRAAGVLAAHGTTGFLATVPTVARARYVAVLDAAAAAMGAGVVGLLGVHLEGPFLSPARRGAHPEQLLQPPDARWLAGLCDTLPGLVRLVTLAPELPGALDVVDACRERGVLVAAGHSQATPEQAARAAPAMVTHLFNGMDPFHHRRPGLAGWALSEPGVVCGLIADGVHVDPLAIRMVFAAKGAGGVALVSDAVSAPDRAEVRDGAWCLDDGTLAGAAVLLDRGVEVCVEAGVARDAALEAAAATPARLLGAAPVL